VRGEAASVPDDAEFDTNYDRTPDVSQIQAELCELVISQARVSKRVKRHPTILELCSGPNKPASRALRRRYLKAKVVTVDVDRDTFPTIVADLVSNLPWPPAYFDIIWASPPCTEYSFAKTVGVRDLTRADAIVGACLRVIEHLKPSAWFIVNPVGLLRERPFMTAYEKYRHTGTYCQYEDSTGEPVKYKKPTDIWSNLELELRHCDVTPCDGRRLNRKHGRTAQGGITKTGTLGTPREQAYEPPAELMDYLIGSAMDERHDNTDWQLRLSAYEDILSPYTPTDTPARNHWFELFASASYLISSEGFTKKDDAFSHYWVHRDFYGNPPYTSTMIHRTLTKALQDHRKAPTTTSFVFVLPKWTSAAWYSLVREFEIIEDWPRGSILFTCLPFDTAHRLTPAHPEGSPGRFFAAGTPWPVMAIRKASVPFLGGGM